MAERGPTGYEAAHHAVRVAKGSATDYACVDCGRPAVQWSYDHRDPDERREVPSRTPMVFSLKVEHYEPRCARCHSRYDHGTKDPWMVRSDLGNAVVDRGPFAGLDPLPLDITRPRSGQINELRSELIELRRFADRFGALAVQQCDEETLSWDHFTPDQVDRYWIRCTLSGPHDEHEDEHTGLTWRTRAADSCTGCTAAKGDPACPVHEGRRPKGPKPPLLGAGCICDGSEAAQQPSAQGEDGNGPETGTEGVADERTWEDT